MNINTWQDNRTSNPLIKEHNEHNLTQVDAINYFYFYLPRWSGRPWTGSGPTTTWTTSSMWSLSSTRRCASIAVNLPFFRHLLHFLLHLSTWISFFINIIDWSTGKCYMTCNDTGYQAISFDEQTHLPKVESDNEMISILLMKLFCFVAKEPAGESLLTWCCV